MATATQAEIDELVAPLIERRPLADTLALLPPNGPS
jgi:hypothetical protein